MSLLSLLFRSSYRIKSRNGVSTASIIVKSPECDTTAISLFQQSSQIEAFSPPHISALSIEALYRSIWFFSTLEWINITPKRREEPSFSGLLRILDRASPSFSLPSTLRMTWEHFFHFHALSCCSLDDSWCSTMLSDASLLPKKTKKWLEKKIKNYSSIVAALEQTLLGFPCCNDVTFKNFFLLTWLDSMLPCFPALVRHLNLLPSCRRLLMLMPLLL